MQQAGPVGYGAGPPQQQMQQPSQPQSLGGFRGYDPRGAGR